MFYCGNSVSSCGFLQKQRQRQGLCEPRLRGIEFRKLESRNRESTSGKKEKQARVGCEAINTVDTPGLLPLGGLGNREEMNLRTVPQQDEKPGAFIL